MAGDGKKRGKVDGTGGGVDDEMRRKGLAIASRRARLIPNSGMLRSVDIVVVTHVSQECRCCRRQ